MIIQKGVCVKKLVGLILCTLIQSITLIHAQNLPPSYGKTQFIIGVSEDELRTQLQNNPQQEQKPVAQPASLARLDVTKSHAFFTPDDDVHALLLDLIVHEKKSIHMAAYMITDKEIAQALVAAHKRGVHVEIVTDASCLKSESGQIDWLKKQGIPVHVYIGASRPSTSNIMHNKFVIFGKNKNDTSFVWTGSFNFTYSARKHNQENVLLLCDAYVVQRYAQQFFVLKNRCINVANDQKSTTVVAHATPKRGKKYRPLKSTKIFA